MFHKASIFCALTGWLLLTGCNDNDTGNTPMENVDWAIHGLTHEEQRFSTLEEINEKTVSRLGLLWSIELESTRGLYIHEFRIVENGPVWS